MPNIKNKGLLFLIYTSIVCASKSIWTNLCFSIKVSPWRFGLEQFRSSVPGPLVCRTRGLNSVALLTGPQKPRLRVTIRWTSLPNCSQVVTSAGQRPEFCITLPVTVTFPYSEGNIFERDVYKRIYYQSIIYYLYCGIFLPSRQIIMSTCQISMLTRQIIMSRLSEKYTHN